MSLDSFFPWNVQAHPVHFLGPLIAGAMVQGVETGILINQSIRFWSRAANEHVLIKVVAVLAMVFAGIQTGMSCYSVWRLTVHEFGNWEAVVDIYWTDKLQSLLNGLTAAPVQSFFIWRCWSVTNRRWYILCPLSLLLTAIVISFVLTTIDIFDLNVATILIDPPKHLPYTYVLAFVLSAALDIVLTGIMLWFLLNAKARVISNRANILIRHLTITMWEAALPPCVAAIVAMAVYISMSSSNFWDLFMQNILGKLYVISLFIVLNGRADLKESPPQASVSAATPSNASRVSRQRAKGSTKAIRVHMTSVVDQFHDSGDIESFELKERARREPRERQDRSKAPKGSWDVQKLEDGLADPSMQRLPPSPQDSEGHEDTLIETQ